MRVPQMIKVVKFEVRAECVRIETFECATAAEATNMMYARLKDIGTDADMFDFSTARIESTLYP